MKGFTQSQVEPCSVPFRNKKQEKLRKARRRCLRSWEMALNGWGKAEEKLAKELEEKEQNKDPL